MPLSLLFGLISFLIFGRDAFSMGPLNKAPFQGRGTPLSKYSGAPLFKGAADVPMAPDTLEVFVLYVKFVNEEPDEPTTTGRGFFGSDPDTTYSLDPNFARDYRYYLDKHFGFAKHYFEKVSNQRVSLKWRAFPSPNDQGLIKAYEVSKRMKAYNPPDKDKREKTAEFAQRRAEAIMSFISESLRLANADALDSNKNPFLIPESPSPKVKRAYMIYHAGHSRLIDGGILGQIDADTPSDLIDFFITKGDFKFLETLKEIKPFPFAEDTLGVKVISGDTINEVMMLSEAATQNKLNWGINGILVNQLARQMGMPDMFDIVRGISQLGYFDVMDFAGYSTMNGFLPVYPSAWVRTFMGWENPVTAQPGDSSVSEYRIWSPLSPPDDDRTTTVKVPINEREYMLIENRQRALGDSVTIYFSTGEGGGRPQEFGKKDSIRIAMAQADSLFLDSICDTKGKNCVVNPIKPKGILDSADSYDLGLPASGLLVWHVNEWFIEQFLKYGAVNAYLGDTLGAQYQGVSLVEADGVLSMGKILTEKTLRQEVFDYGSGQDMLPHVRRWIKDPTGRDTTRVADTIRFIGPYGQANTGAWNDGKTHILLEAPLPTQASIEKSQSFFSGDSLLNFRDSALTLRVHWPDNKELVRKPGGSWPVQLDPGTHPHSLNIVKSTGNTVGTDKFLVAMSDRGYPQVLSASGRAALPSRDTLILKTGYDSVFTKLPSRQSHDTVKIPIPALGDSLGKALGSAVLEDSVLAVLTGKGLHLFRLRVAGADFLDFKPADSSGAGDSGFVRLSVSVKGVAGPMALGEKIWIVNDNHHAVSYDRNGLRQDSIALSSWSFHSLAAWGKDAAGKGIVPPSFLAISAEGGRVVLVDTEAGISRDVQVSWKNLNPMEGEFFTLSSSDFNRDGSNDLLLLGSRGSVHLLGLDDAEKGSAFPNFPLRFPRSVVFTDSNVTYVAEDRSAPALADLDGDGYVDFLFTGTNAVHAVNFRGAPLKGWPFFLEKRQNVGLLYGDRKNPETVISSTPLVVAMGKGNPTVLVASPDGLIWAVDKDGKPLKSSSFTGSRQKYMGALASDTLDWPLTVGGLNTDTNDVPYIHLYLDDVDGGGDLELMAQTGTGSLNLWSLKRAAAETGIFWAMPGGNPQRHNYLEAAQLASPALRNGEDRIEKFYLFPSPVKGSHATVHLQLGRPAIKARIRIYDLAGSKVKDHAWTDLQEGLQPHNQILDLSHLGADVYSATVEVWFDSGKKRQKWERFGIIR